MKIPVLSLHQPWATMVALGVKPIETRRHTLHKSLNGKFIAIHATCKYVATVPYTYLRRIPIPFQYYKEYQKAILAIAYVHDFRKLTAKDTSKACIDCSGDDLYGLFLSKPQLLKSPIMIPGKQNVWYYDFSEEELEGIDLSNPQTLF